MSLDAVSVVTVEDTSFVVDVVTPPVVSSAIDATVIDPAVAIVVDVSGNPVEAIDVMAPSPLFAVDVTVGNPLAAIVVDIPGSSSDEVIGGKITIGNTPPSSPSVGDIWVDTT